MTRGLLRHARILGANAIFVAALSGCSSAVHLHDAGNAKSAQSADEKYKAAEVTTVLDVEQANLTALLKNELEIVRDNRQLRFELELLSLAADETVPMARLLFEAQDRLRAIGLKGAKSARAFLIANVTVEGLKTSMTDSQARANVAGGPQFPECREGVALPELGLGTNLNALQIAAISKEYESYKSRCAELLLVSLSASGDLAQKQKAMAEARQRVLELRAEIKTGKASTAAIEREKKAAEEAGKAAKIGDTIKEKVGKADKILNSGVKALGALGLEHPAFERIDALQTILGAVASGSVAEAFDTDKELQKAAAVAAKIPGLSQDIADLIAKAKAPSVSNLLIALNHQKILIAADEARLLLAQQRVDFLQQQVEALIDELRALRDLHDGFCNFAVRSTGQPHPGQKCDSFTASAVRDADGRTIGATCDFQGSNLPDCALTKPWREALKISGNDVNDRAAKRALYASIGSLALAHDARTEFIELDYRLIALDHNEAVASNRLALEAWDNLVAVPVERIAGYHAAGLKPSEIADLIVKVLGIAAITTAIATDD